MTPKMNKDEQNWLNLYQDMIAHSAVIKKHPAQTTLLDKLDELTWRMGDFSLGFKTEFPARFETLVQHYDTGITDPLFNMSAGAAYHGIDKKNLSKTLLNYAVQAQTSSQLYSLPLITQALSFNGGVLTEPALKHIAFIDEKMSWQAHMDMAMTWRDRPDMAYEGFKRDYINTPKKKIQVGNAIVDYAVAQIEAEAPLQTGGAKRLFSKRILRGMAFGTTDNKTTARDALQRITDTYATGEHELNEQFLFLDAIRPVIGEHVILDSLENKVTHLATLAATHPTVGKQMDFKKSAAATALYIAAHDPSYLKRNKTYFADALNNPVMGDEGWPNPDFHLHARMMYPYDATFYKEGWGHHFNAKKDSMYRNASYAFAEAVKTDPDGPYAIQYAEDAITSHPIQKHKTAMLGFLSAKIGIGGEQGTAAIGKINNLVRERILDADKAKQIKSLYPQNGQSIVDQERELVKALYAKYDINA